MSRDTKNVMASANGKSCVSCGNIGRVCARHYNGVRQHSYGKGMRIKGHVLATAELCDACESSFSEGRMPEHCTDKYDRSELFLHYVMLTNIRRLEDGVLVVK